MKCTSYDVMNANSKVLWKSFSRSVLETHKAESEAHMIARGDFEPPHTFSDLKPEPKDDNHGFLACQFQFCYRQGPYCSQIVRHVEGRST